MSTPLPATHEEPRTAPVADRRHEAPPEALGKYRLQRELGSGGMGTVYLATDTEQKRRVAVKVLPRASAANPSLVKRFEAEAEAARQLNHENIVSIFEAGEDGGWLYITMEFVEGIDLHRLLKRQGPLPVRRTLEIIKQVCRALDHAFRQGIVHRDIKPSNMIIKRNGTVKLADMGLARSVDEDEDVLTRAGMTVGTVDYMSPEQARDSSAADVRSDIYSLGCAWYHMLTGSPPFPKGSITNKLYAHIDDPRPDPRALNDQVPATVAQIVMKMMARQARDRFHTPQELLEKLERISFRADEVSARFLSDLSDVIDRRTDELSGFVEVPETQGASRTARAPARRRKRRRHAGLQWLRESGEVFGILFGTLLLLSALWWLLVSFVTAGG